MKLDKEKQKPFIKNIYWNLEKNVIEIPPQNSPSIQVPSKSQAKLPSQVPLKDLKIDMTPQISTIVETLILPHIRLL